MPDRIYQTIPAGCFCKSEKMSRRKTGGKCRLRYLSAGSNRRNRKKDCCNDRFRADPILYYLPAHRSRGRPSHYNGPLLSVQTWLMLEIIFLFILLNIFIFSLQFCFKRIVPVQIFSCKNSVQVVFFQHPFECYKPAGAVFCLV